MKDSLYKGKLESIRDDIGRDWLSHIDTRDFIMNEVNGRPLFAEMKFDIRKHYKILKQSHPLYASLYLQKENEIKKSYISGIDNVSFLLKSDIQSPKVCVSKKYGMEKLSKFKKSKEINFDQIYEKMKNIGYYLIEKLTNMKEWAKGTRKPSYRQLCNQFAVVHSPRTIGVCLTQREITGMQQRGYPKQLKEQKVVRIDLKNSRNESVNETLNQKQAARNTQSVGGYSTKDGSKDEGSFCSTGQKIQRKTVINLRREKFKPLHFNQSYSYELKFDELGGRVLNQNNWDETIQIRKKQLYSKLYKMDKKLLAIERDLQHQKNVQNKSKMEEIKKKKTIQKEIRYGPIQIHTSLYRTVKNKKKCQY